MDGADRLPGPRNRAASTRPAIYNTLRSCQGRFRAMYFGTERAHFKLSHYACPEQCGIRRYSALECTVLGRRGGTCERKGAEVAKRGRSLMKRQLFCAKRNLLHGSQAFRIPWLRELGRVPISMQIFVGARVARFRRVLCDFVARTGARGILSRIQPDDGWGLRDRDASHCASEQSTIHGRGKCRASGGCGLYQP